MASDNLNLLEGLAGAISGFTSVYLPLQQELFKKRLNSTPVSDFEAITGKKTGLDPRKFLTDNEMELELFTMKEKDAAEKLRQQHDFERSQTEAEHQNRQKEESFKIDEEMRKESQTETTLVDPVTGMPKLKVRGKFEQLTPPKVTTSQQSKNAKDIDLLNSTLRSFDELMTNYDKGRGSSGTMMSGLKGMASSLSRGMIDPSAKVYKDRVKEFVQTANKQLTGTSRGTQVAIGAATQSLPEFFESHESAQSKRQQFRNLILARIEELGGEQSDKVEPLTPPGFSQPKATQSISQSDLQVGKEFGGGKIKAVRWK